MVGQKQKELIKRKHRRHKNELGQKDSISLTDVLEIISKESEV